MTDLEKELLDIIKDERTHTLHRTEFIKTPVYLHLLGIKGLYAFTYLSSNGGFRTTFCKSYGVQSRKTDLGGGVVVRYPKSEIEVTEEFKQKYISLLNKFDKCRLSRGEHRGNETLTEFVRNIFERNDK